jgi:CubicO group peptidase (beta-lactamase class C family)
MSDIQGSTHPKFAHLRDVYGRNFADGLEYGSAVAVVIDGEVVVDLWGGHTDKARQKPWARDTLVNVWSVTKAVMAIATAILVERGKLRYDQPIAEIWPEFAANGKSGITLDLVMSHQAGLNGLSVPMTAEQVMAWSPYVDALAAMAPLWEPGSRSAYHALTYGHLVGETLRRADGRLVSQIIQDEISRKLGVSFFVGLPEAEDHRAAEMIEGPKAIDWVTNTLASDYPHGCQNPTPSPDDPNHRAWRAAEIPGGNGHGDALGLAKIMGNVVGSHSPLLSPAGLAAATRVRFDGIDVSGYPSKWAAGVSARAENYCSRAAQGTFGHGGWGGSLAFADPKARLGFAYVTNHMLGFDDGIDPRRQRLIEAVYDVL